MKRQILISVCLCFILFGFSQDNNGDLILGDWLGPEKNIIVQCYKKNNMYYGKVVWFKKYYYDLKHDPNVIPERKWMNTDVIAKFKYLDNEWSGGEIYALRKGKTYEGYIRMEDRNTMQVTGFMYLKILNETLTFTRYPKKELPPF